MSFVSKHFDKHIRNYFDDIKKYADIVKNRLEDEECTLEFGVEDNARFSKLAEDHNVNCVFIDGKYEINIKL